MYQEYSPHPILSPYVDKYWEMKGVLETGEKMKILPDGCTDFIFGNYIHPYSHPKYLII